MEMIERICPHCHAANPVQALYCGTCATRLRSGTTALARREPGMLIPHRWRDAGTAVAIGLAAIAGRVAVELLRRPELVGGALRALSRRSVPQQEAPLAPQQRPTTIIRRRWVVGDAYGRQHWGSEEIEIQHPE
jgi:hypothetical protein